MKKITLCLVTACLSLMFHPLAASNSTSAASSSLVIPKPTESTEAKTLLVRLDEINAMDKSNLKSSDKKKLRMEVRSIKHQLKVIGGGVYISAGAIIIILLLLIILL